MRLTAGRTLLAGVVLLVAVESALLHARSLQLPLADPTRALSATPDAPALPGRVTSDAPTPAPSAVPLPDSLLPERPSLPGLQPRALDAPPTSARPADARHCPTPARGPPA